MKYKGTLIVVKDCNRALKFYSDMFGFQLLQDNDGNMELTNNLYLQELGYWEQFTKRSVISNSNQSELYFEEPDIEQFVERLETLYPEIEYVNHLITHSWGQKVVRFYDFDGNLIEVGTPGAADKILDYADRPSFCLYSSGLSPPREILIRFSRYQTI